MVEILAQDEANENYLVNKMAVFIIRDAERTAAVDLCEYRTAYDGGEYD